MAGSYDGAVRTAAKRIGVTEVEYRQRVAQGEKWCCGCKAWHRWHQFGFDKTRGDGLTARCLESRNRRARELYAG